ncbi:hypothetical protein [Lysinibacillus endophyticus]|uniref:hypothetical protein n=1 Tax=Ureibacillus endophyticus TaxID=1978490 RepID=UPI00209F07AC|nr:hypothetical protein [Lysinibacillus endophyticus]MCP1144750.1 hypothetical protein [Lysinibacillus endophyticus]
MMEPKELIVQQAKNVLDSAKELRAIAHKSGKKRGSYIQRYTANKHSLQIHTNMDPSIRDSEEMQNLLKNLQSFDAEFNSARYDFEGEVNIDQVETIYPEIVNAYNALVTALDLPNEAVNIKKYK